jgi:valyl-tRNA synthetase
LVIFPNKLNSIHGRGSWCKLENYILDEQALEIGGVMLEVIFNIRKFKSDSNLSMKTPIQKFSINTKTNISAVIADLQNVCNTAEILIENQDNSNLVYNLILI